MDHSGFVARLKRGGRRRHKGARVGDKDTEGQKEEG